MHKSKSVSLGSLFLAVAFLFSTVTMGCAHRDSGRVYDSEHHDYHQWDSNESGYYQRWEAETHRDHKDFQQRSRDEQNEYWNWRHQHEGGDRH